MRKRGNSPQPFGDARKRPKRTVQEIAEAIASLVKFARRSEEMVHTRSAEVGVAARTLRRWLAAHDNLPRSNTTRFGLEFPVAALFVTLKHSEGVSVRAIRKTLALEWPNIYPGTSCPCYTTLLCFVRSRTSSPAPQQEPGT